MGTADLAATRDRGREDSDEHAKLSRQKTELQGSDSAPVAKLGPDIKAKIGQQLRLSEFRRALKMLSREQREWLILVGSVGVFI